MSLALLQGQWQNNMKLNIIIECFNAQEYKNKLYVKAFQQRDHNTMDINGSYYETEDGLILTFHLFHNDTLVNYSGKLYYTHPNLMYLEAVTTANHAKSYYAQNLWSLYDSLEHENFVFTRVK